MTDPVFFHHNDLVAVLTAEPLDRLLDYKAPEGGCWEGAFVEVPLGPRKVIGVVWGQGAGQFDPKRIRPITRVLDVAPMQENMRDFLTRLADYTLSPLSAVLRLATRAPGLGDPPSMRHVYRLGQGDPDRMTPARQRVLDVLRDHGGLGFALQELAQMADVTPSVIHGLVKLEAVQKEDAPRDAPFPALDPDHGGKSLSSDQKNAAKALKQAVQKGGYGTTLLRGVTGSGKTEVYLEAVAQTLKYGQQALVLLPEIALSGEFLTRVEARFGARPAEWHSGIPMAERRRTWKMVGQGGAQMVVGARSALFLPFQNLGLIVVDEEHDTSYKQEDGVLYHARDMAVLRASLCGAQVVLASATPSLESWANAKSGKYARLDLTSRFGAAVLPDLQAIDMRGENMPADRWISPSLQKAVEQRLNAGEQSLLFLNRRGYAPLTLCRACGHQLGCDHCDARLVEHRYENRLVCHQCGANHAIPTTCPSCGAEDRLTALGPGVERLQEEAEKLFPQARVATLSSDHFGSARAIKAQIETLAAGQADIIIGTQLVAKGHNFPLLTLVGVIDTDLGLQGGDLRAGERSFQLIQQVAGRAGRAERQGQALLQTHQPAHPVIQSILRGDFEGFCQAESEDRALIGMPPYGRLVGVIVSGAEAAQTYDFALELVRNCAPLTQINAQLFGPAPAPIARIRDRHRVRLLIKAPKTAPLQNAIKAWLKPFPRPKGIKITIDIDPQSFL